MNREQTLEKMRQLRLFGMHEAYQVSSRQHTELTNDELMALLIDAEWQDKQHRKIKRLTTQAKFRYKASFSELDYQANRSLNKDLMIRLATCQFIRQSENILISGPTGAGKSFIASALGHQACNMGHKTIYFNAMKLFAHLKASRVDASYTKIIRQMEKADLLIIDDFGLQNLDTDQRNMLMEIIEDRHNNKSTVIASQLPVKAWYEVIGENTIADAILDRLVHTAHRIELTGESMRKTMKKN